MVVVSWLMYYEKFGNHKLTEFDIKDTNANKRYFDIKNSSSQWILGVPGSPVDCWHLVLIAVVQVQSWLGSENPTSHAVVETSNEILLKKFQNILQKNLYIRFKYSSFFCNFIIEYISEKAHVHSATSYMNWKKKRYIKL